MRERDAAGAIVRERNLTRAELAGFIKSAREGKGNAGGDLAVLIGGDKSARYESVLGVMDELRKLGVQKVGLQVKTNP